MKFTQTNTSILYRLLLFLLCVSASLHLNTTAEAQIKPVYDRGAMGLGQLLKRINTTASVLMIGAHPDDEDTALLTYLARGESARTAYLSLTRGDGGQNIIGPELGEALGVIRTEELLQARKLDGAEQFFTRAYDYGFSKTLDEAKQKWDEKVVLCDVVRVIRNFRPLVVVSQFSGTPADGHGHHQFAGYISPIAVKAAADPTQCTDAGAAVEVKKFYVRHRGQSEPTLRINTGKYDPLLGRSYFEIAMEARSQHKSQEQGVLELKGDQFSALTLVGANAATAATAKETGIFDGLDISTSQLRPEVVNSVATALSKNQPQTPTAIVPILLDGYSGNLRHKIDLLNSAFDRHDCVPRCDAPTTESVRFRNEARSKFTVVHAKQNEFVKAILLAAGIRVDVLSDRETVVPGDEMPVSIRLFYPPNQKVDLHDIRFNLPQTATTPSPTPSQPQSRREVPSLSVEYKLSVPKNYPVSQPFWLYEKKDGNLFSTGTYSDYRAFQDPAIRATFMIVIGGKYILMELPVEYRYADDIRGEVRREVNIVPRLSVEVGQELVIVPSSTSSINRDISVTVTNNTTGLIKGSAALKLPKNWVLVPSNMDFALDRYGEKRSFKFKVTIPPDTPSDLYIVEAEATANGEKYSQTMQTISYDHIQTHRTYRAAKADVKIFDLNIALLKVGYIPGSGDRVADAIRQMGINVEVLSESDVASGDLSRFDTIVVGIRAYQVRPDLVANNKRLLDFANNGGTLIVQYQLPGYAQQNLMPYPAQMGPRVADENAKVTVQQPEHPIFNFPNKITDADFSGWVQERNLYNFSTMDAKYTGLLESHDVGEAENNGGLVIADVGKGKYVYCSYSLFRQLPAGVPGAYRLLANMLSFSKAKK